VKPKNGTKEFSIYNPLKRIKRYKKNDEERKHIAFLKGKKEHRRN